jgi:DNA repair exonuclease SbcCD nuclease subunit
MGVVIFSDVHADVEAVTALAACIRDPLFPAAFGPVDLIVNLGDILHRGDHPKEALEFILELSREFLLVSVLGNHDHAFLNGIPVSGSDEASVYRHEQLRGSPLLAIFHDMPMEWVHGGMLFVHGGPLDLGTQTLRLKCWQRLSRVAGDSFTGYHYTAPMAFEALARRGLSHMVCGHQHSHVCCRKTPAGVLQYPVKFAPWHMYGETGYQMETAPVPLDVPTLFRIGGCHGDEPEFAYVDGSVFSFIRLKTMTDS